MFRNNSWCAILIYTGEESFIDFLLLFLSLYITPVSLIIFLSYDFTSIFYIYLIPFIVIFRRHSSCTFFGIKLMINFVANFNEILLNIENLYYMNSSWKIPPAHGCYFVTLFRLKYVNTSTNEPFI